MKFMSDRSLKNLMESTMGTVNAKDDQYSEVSQSSILEMYYPGDETLFLSDADWQYQIDESRSVVKLLKYIGTGPNVVVHRMYAIGDNVYKTEYAVNGAFANASNRNSIKSVRFDDGVKVTTNNFQELFSQFQYLESVAFGKVDTSTVTNMSFMFQKTYRIKTIDVSNLDVSNVVDMRYMFNDITDSVISYPVTVDLSNFNTKSLKYIDRMFSNATRIAGINMSGFNISKVTDMTNLFNGCSKLTSLKISGWDTSNVTIMTGMFKGCKKLKKIDVSGFNTTKVKNMKDMFYECQALTSLDLSRFNTDKVETMQNMFYNCQTLAELNVSSFNTSACTNMGSMFDSMTGLTSLNVSNFNTSKVQTFGYMFSGTNLTYIDMRNFDMSAATDIRGMFKNCKKLTGFNDGNVFNAMPNYNAKKTDLFKDCESITFIDLRYVCEDLDSGNINSQLFNGCTNLEEVIVSAENWRGFNDEILNMSNWGVFTGCKCSDFTYV